MNETTRFILQLIGPTIVVVGVSLAGERKNYLQMIKDMDKQPMALFTSGLMTFIVGLSILLHHNLYGSVAEIIVTVFGWIAMIKGVILIIMPRSSVKMGKSMTSFMKFIPYVWILLGAYIWWLAYFS